VHLEILIAHSFEFLPLLPIINDVYDLFLILKELKT